MSLLCSKLTFLLFLLINIQLLNPQMVWAGHKIVASVNDKPISLGDLEEKTKLLLLFSGQEDTAENRNLFTKEALKLMIREMLQLQFIEKLGIKFSDKEYADALERLEMMNGQKPGFITEIAKQHGIGNKILKQSIMSNYAWEMFISERYRSVASPSQGEVDKRLEFHKKNRNMPHIRLAEIVIPFEGPDSERTAHETMDKVVHMLHEGASFINLVQQFSKAPSAGSGGDLGWVLEAHLEPEVQKHVGHVAKNHISKIVKTGNAYKLFFVIDRRAKSPEPEPVTTYSYVQAFIPKPKNVTVIELKKVEEKAHSVQQTARSEAMLKSFLKNVVGHQIKAFEQKVEKELSPAIFKQLKSLNPGEASPLLDRPEGYYVLILTKKQNYTGDDLLRQSAESELRYHRSMTFSQKEMKKIRRSAHVEFRAPEFQSLNY